MQLMYRLIDIEFVSIRSQPFQTFEWINYYRETSALLPWEVKYNVLPHVIWPKGSLAYALV